MPKKSTAPPVPTPKAIPFGKAPYILLKADQPIAELDIRAGDVIRIERGQASTLHRHLDADVVDLCQALDDGTLRRVGSPAGSHLSLITAHPAKPKRSRRAS